MCVAPELVDNAYPVELCIMSGTCAVWGQIHYLSTIPAPQTLPDTRPGFNENSHLVADLVHV